MEFLTDSTVFRGRPIDFDNSRLQYLDNGYCLLKEFFSVEEVEMIKAEIQRLCDECPAHITRENAVESATSVVIHKISHFVEKSELMGRLVSSFNMLELIKRIAGNDVLLCTDKINFKQPGGRGFYPHQDMSGAWQNYLPNIITAFIAVDKADETNGCLEIAPGFHNKGLLGPYMGAINPEELEKMNFTPIMMNPGDLLLFDGFAPHQSAPNHSDRHRKAILFTYNLKSKGDLRPQYLKDFYSSQPIKMK